MKLRAERTEFAEAVIWATRTVGARVTLPALAGVLLDASEGRLTCRSTDLEVAAEVSIPVQIDEPGQALLPGKLLSQLVSKLPDAPVELAGSEDRLEIDCGRSHYGVRGMPVSDFPALPQPDEDAATGVIKADAFARLVSQVARAASTDEARPVLTGVKLEATTETLTAAATDSYRLAVRSLAWDTGVEAEALIPARALQEAAKAGSEVGGGVTLILEEGQVSFLFGDRRLTTRLIEGAFPNYRKLLPDGFETAVRVDRAELVEALQRVAVVALGQANSPVTLAFGDGSCDLRAGSSEVGDASEGLPAEVDGDGLEISFNPQFLLNGLEATGTEKIQIELRDGLKPAVLRPYVDPEEDADAATDDLTYLLMPMRVS